MEMSFLSERHWMDVCHWDKGTFSFCRGPLPARVSSPQQVSGWETSEQLKCVLHSPCPRARAVLVGPWWAPFLSLCCGDWIAIGFAVWFPGPDFQFSAHQCLTRALCILTPLGRVDSPTSVVFVPYLFVGLPRRLADIYSSAGLLSIWRPVWQGLAPPSSCRRPGLVARLSRRPTRLEAGRLGEGRVRPVLSPVLPSREGGAPRGSGDIWRNGHFPFRSFLHFSSFPFLSP